MLSLLHWSVVPWHLLKKCRYDLLPVYIVQDTEDKMDLGRLEVVQRPHKSGRWDSFNLVLAV